MSNKLFAAGALFFMWVVTMLPARAQNISTIAGNGRHGYAGDGGTATSAELHEPQGIALDGSGNVYFSDQFNNRIRKVTVATGIITTIAGTGDTTYGGDGGAAVSAQLHYPAGIALDGLGNVYIADQYSHRIRKITVATGIITTIAGTGISGFNGDGMTATSAQLSYPAGIALDSSGNIYIADEENNRIRKITVATGMITTIAGYGIAGFSGDGGGANGAQINFPSGVAVDNSGNVFIADYNNHRIRKVTATTGGIATIAGTGTAGLSGDGAAATSAQLNYPVGVALDGSENVYISDAENYRIRKISVATGIITTIAGTTNNLGTFTGDGGAATSATLDIPTSIVIDHSGSVYIADHGHERVRKITYTTGVPNVQSLPSTLSLYPNPTTGSFTAEVTEAGMLYLYNLQGQIVAQTQLSAGKTTLHMPEVPNGIYTGRFVGEKSGAVNVVRLLYEQ